MSYDSEHLSRHFILSTKNSEIRDAITFDHQTESKKYKSPSCKLARCAVDRKKMHHNFSFIFIIHTSKNILEAYLREIVKNRHSHLNPWIQLNSG